MASSNKSSNLNKSLTESTTQLQLDTTASTSSPGIGIGISIIAALQLEDDGWDLFGYSRLQAPLEPKSPPTTLKTCSCLRCRDRRARAAAAKKIVRSKPCECFVCTISRSLSISDQHQLENSLSVWSPEKFIAPPEQKSPPTSLNGQLQIVMTVGAKPGSCYIESGSGGDGSAMLQEEDEDKDKQLLNIQLYSDKQTMDLYLSAMDLYSSACKWGSLNEYLRNVIVKYKCKSKSSKLIKEENLVVVSMAVYAFCIVVFEP